MPPDYLSYIQDPTIFDIMAFVVKFYLMMFVFMVLNVAFMVASIWALLIVFRILGIPWLDGTTKGFVNRS